MKEADEPQLVSENLQQAVSPDKTGVVFVKLFPPVVYPDEVEVTS